MERDRFLGRVAAARIAGTLPEIPRRPPVPEIDFEDPVGVFVSRAQAVAAEVSRGSPRQAIEVIDSVFSATGEHRYLAWDGLDRFLPGVTDHLAIAGKELVDARIAFDAQERKVDHSRVGQVAVGITGADFAIAASGSVVLQHGPGRPRSASLLVEHHIVLLPANWIVASLQEAMKRVDPVTTSNVVAITGPSRTGDIGSVLTLGVHGPRHLSVVVVD